MVKHYTLVTTPAALLPLLEMVRTRPTIAIDTEADSRHHYHEKLCLIQISAAGRCWIVDPLAEGLDLTPLMELLAQRQLLFHGADYDLRLLFRTYGFKPVDVFDTMLAAQLLGWPHFSLAHLVYAICNIELDKSNQQADWSQRPLEPDLLNYAADDTRYLFRVARALQRHLRDEGRLEWHWQACQRLIQAAQTENSKKDEDGWRIKGGKHLQGRSAAVLRELWQWRDRIARRLDRPPYKIANNEFILQWAKWAEENPKGTFEQAPARPHWLRGPRLESFERALQRGLTLPSGQWPRREHHKGNGRLSHTQEDILVQIIAQRDQLAKQLGLDPAVIAPREALRTIVRAHPADEKEYKKASPLLPWQNQCLAAPVLEVLERTK